VQFSVDYPDRLLNRLTSVFRIFTIIPIAMVLGTVAGATYSTANARGGTTAAAAGTGGILFLGPLLMILFRQKYPRWWFDWNRELLRFQARLGAYFALMSDQYPSTDEEQYVHFGVRLSRGAAGPQPLAAPGEVVPGHSALRGAVLPLHRGAGRGAHRVVRHPLHREIPAGAVPFRRGSLPLVEPSLGIRHHPGHRSVSTVPAGALSTEERTWQSTEHSGNLNPGPWSRRGGTTDC
jgi:hypothetical protein